MATDSIIQDIRYAVRGLRRAPLVTASVAGTIGNDNRGHAGKSGRKPSAVLRRSAPGMAADKFGTLWMKLALRPQMT